MALLNFDRHKTVVKLKEDFNSETGLNLIIYSGDEQVKDNIKLEKLLKKEECLCRHHFTRQLHNYFSFKFNLSVLDFKKELLEIFGLKTDIADSKNILPDDASLFDYIPSIIKNKKYDHKKIDTLNERLIKIEEDIYNQWLKLKTGLDPGLTDPSGWLKDYEIELEIGYYIDDSNPIYDDDSENLIIIYTKSLGKREWRALLHDGEDHPTLPIIKKLTSPQCYLFHDLVDHYGLSFLDLQRFGSISVDIKVLHQHCYDKNI